MTDTDQLVADYLRRLELAAEPLPAERRQELLEDVSAHISDARTAGASSEADIQDLLARLGDPDEIVLAATDGLVQVKRQPRFRSREVAALLLLPFGGFLYLVGWIAGVALLWTSDRWTSTEKLLGTLVLPFGYLPVLMLGSLSGRTCQADTNGVLLGCGGYTFPEWFRFPLLLALSLAPIVVLFILLKNAARGRSTA